MERSLRLLIVDDSALYRQLLRNVLRDVPGVEVVGAAANGEEALAQIDALLPDLLTLDVRMPGIDGIGVLRELKRRSSPARAIMVSGLTASGAQITTDALLEGAFDFILKPGGPDAQSNRHELRSTLTEKIGAFRDSRRGSPGRRPPDGGTVRTSAEEASDAEEPSLRECRAVLIATSTGGPVALRELLPRLPGAFPAPVLIVQHMPAQYTHSLAERLNQASEIEVVEACDGMPIEPGFAYLAPGGRQMKLAGRHGKTLVRITDDPPENGVRPAADYLFRSAADVLGGQVIAVILTGMGRDGAAGCRELRNKGALVVAQHPDGCVVYGMPKAVVDEQLAHRQIPLDQMAGWLAARMRTARSMR